MPLSRGLEIDDAALQANGDGMSAVVGAEFREDILDVAFDRLFGDAQLIGDDFVCVPGSDQAQDLDFAGGQGVVGKMVSELGGNIGWDTLLSSVDGANCIEEFLAEETFQEESPSAGLEGARNLNVARVGCEHDESRIGKLASNGDDGINAIHVGHLEVHERDIGSVQAELFDRFTSGGSLGYDFHVRLIGDKGADAFAKERMIIDGEYSNQLGIGGHPLVFAFLWNN